MKKGRYKNLFGNMALFTLGNFVSKLLVMLLVPFYTNILTTAEYGIADGMQATLLLLVPLLTINIGEAALRYGIEGRGDRDILRVLVKYVGLADILVMVACLAGYMLAGHEYFLLFAGLFICNSIYESVILYCQGREQVKLMITGSMLCTLLIIVSNLYFLLVLRIGLYGYLFSQMIAYGVSAAFMLLFMKRMWQSSNQAMDNALEKDMVSYGKGMLLYSTSSWVNNALDRYFVLGMCGAAANGLYAVAYKIPAILTVFQRIFAQAWQISANKNYEDEDSSEFFSQVYMAYQTVMAVGCSGLIMLTKPVATLLFAKEFFNAWTLVPPLLISVIFGALTGFLGSICLAYKDGESMGRATGIGALVNIVLNYIGIRLIGPMGAAIATMLSYYTMYAFAYRAVRKHVKLYVNLKLDYIAYGILLLQTLTIILKLPHLYLLQIVGFMGIMIIYGRRFWGILIKKLRG